jgi:hypothetical protein
MGFCWICGLVANTSEHKFKKTDLKAIYPKIAVRYIMQRYDVDYNIEKRKTLVQGGSKGT